MILERAKPHRAQVTLLAAELVYSWSGRQGVGLPSTLKFLSH